MTETKPSNNSRKLMSAEWYRRSLEKHQGVQELLDKVREGLERAVRQAGKGVVINTRGYNDEVGSAAQLILTKNYAFTSSYDTNSRSLVVEL